ncbi:ferritin-like domain-containing protein [Thermococcus paralvinellae]|uniref:Rubrerythrin n=1 Tax=Thermococcus paralvinellae TaxID=582419 RepID=W0I1E6_9EURY|nr:ferritin family protein [Thermococcus paralvinellae]AHF79834.1 rubrerythrin [Thermococcus paralvinellae]
METPLDVFMKKAEIEEKVKELLAQITKMPLKDILSYIIKGERDATELYTFLYENIPSPYHKEKFKEFIEMEKSHDMKVMEIFKTLFPNEEPRDIKIESWKKTFEEREYKLKNILEIAMEAEKLAEEIYLYLEKNVENREHKRIFLELANDERYHYDFVSKEYEIYEKAKAEEELQKLIKELMKDKEKKNNHSAGA